MSETPKRGYPAKYVLLKSLVLPADLAYVHEVQDGQSLKTRNHAVRLILEAAREARLFLKPEASAE